MNVGGRGRRGGEGIPGGLQRSIVRRRGGGEEGGGGEGEGGGGGDGGVPDIKSAQRAPTTPEGSRHNPSRLCFKLSTFETLH